MAAEFLRNVWLSSLSNLACTQPLRSSFCHTYRVATTLAGTLGLTLKVACPWPKVARGNCLPGTCQLWHVLEGLEIDLNIEHIVLKNSKRAFQLWSPFCQGPLCHELCQFQCSHPGKVLTSQVNMNFSGNCPSKET